jgi:hypothetical protein
MSPPSHIAQWHDREGSIRDLCGHVLKFTDRRRCWSANLTHLRLGLAVARKAGVEVEGPRCAGSCATRVKIPSSHRPRLLQQSALHPARSCLPSVPSALETAPNKSHTPQQPSQVSVVTRAPVSQKTTLRWASRTKLVATIPIMARMTSTANMPAVSSEAWLA